VEKNLEKWPVGRQEKRWKDNIQMGVGEIDCEVEIWLDWLRIMTSGGLCF
jgi:hypothetical protein